MRAIKGAATAVALGLVVAGGSASAAQAPASGGWTDPVALPTTADPAPPGLSVQGGELIAATVAPDFVCGSTPPLAHVARVRPDGGVDRLPDVRRAIAVTALGNGRVAALTRRATNRSRYFCGERSVVALRVGGRTVPVSSGTVVDAAAVRADRRGTVAVAWRDQVRRRVRLHVLVVRPGRAPVRRRIATGAIEEYYGGELGDVALTTAGPGRFVVAYARTSLSGGARVIRAVDVRASGRVSRKRTLGRTSDVSYLTAGANAAGRVVVAWGQQDGGEERNIPYAVRVAVREPGARRFERAQVVDRGLRPVHTFQRPAGGPYVALARDGTATVAWTRSRERPTQPLSVATAAPGQRFGPATTLGQVGELGGVAVRDDGAAVLLTRTDEGDVVAHTRPAGAAAFGSPELLATGATTVSAVAFHPATGRPVAAWGAHRVEIQDETDQVRLATRRDAP